MNKFYNELLEVEVVDELAEVVVVVDVVVEEVVVVEEEDYN